MRVVIAEDSVLLREGLERLLTDNGLDVVGTCESAEELLRMVTTTAPDVAIVDIRLPPTHNDEGLRAALEIRARHPSVVGVAATRARSSRTSSHLATRVRGTSGRWLRVTAVPMDSDDGSVAVTIEPARAWDLYPILLESYGLTDRFHGAVHRVG